MKTRGTVETSNTKREIEMKTSKLGKYTVAVTKKDGAKSTYYVYALSNGGAEMIVLKSVYNALGALSEKGWPAGVAEADLISDGVMKKAIAKLLEEAA